MAMINIITQESTPPISIPSTSSYNSPYKTNEDLQKFRGFTHITGNLYIYPTEQIDFSVFSSLVDITGNFSIGYSADTFNTGHSTALTSISGFNNLASVGGYFYIEYNDALTTIGGFDNLTTVGDFKISYNNELTTISVFNKLTSVRYYFYINNNDTLTTIGGFQNLASVGIDFVIRNNAALTSIDGFNKLTSVRESFAIYYNGGSATPVINKVATTVSGFSAINSINAGNWFWGLALKGADADHLLAITKQLKDNIEGAVKNGTKEINHIYEIPPPPPTQ